MSGFAPLFHVKRAYLCVYTVAQTIRAAPNDGRRARMTSRVPPVLPYMHGFSLYAKFCAALRRRNVIWATKMGVCGFRDLTWPPLGVFFAIFLGVSGLFVYFCAENCDFLVFAMRTTGIFYKFNCRLLPVNLPPVRMNLPWFCRVTDILTKVVVIMVTDFDTL